MDLSSIRRAPAGGGLDEADLDPDPFTQFRIWFDRALEADLVEPTAMTLATAASGRVAARMVLLKGFDEEGFVFYSNYGSRKASDLAQNPQAALLFYWDRLERQIRIEGTVAKTSREVAAAYFATRPRGSQLGALASPQSRILASRAELEERWRELADRYPEGEIPLPDHWGGFRLKPDSFEFWQGRPSRLHDRIRYRLESGSWRLERLAP